MPLDVGEFGYPRGITGKCEDVGNRKQIQDKATCEVAATSMGLIGVGVEASVVSLPYVLPGCFWDGSGAHSNMLNYNTNTQSASTLYFGKLKSCNTNV